MLAQTRFHPLRRPGWEAIQLAICISGLARGVHGAIVARAMFFMPAFVLLSVVALAFPDYLLERGDAAVGKKQARCARVRMAEPVGS
jgi:hypothetical protein